ncbi:MAG: hypothetical protein ACM3ZA_02490 [Bacillota bacterium]
MTSVASVPRQARRSAPWPMAWLLTAALLLSSATAAAASPRASAPEADVAHLVLSREGDNLGVFEMVSLMNETTNPTGPLVLPLPEGTTGLTLDGEPDTTNGVVAAGNRVEIPAGLPAGGRLELAFRYQVPAAGESLEFQVTLPFRSQHVYVLTDAHAMVLNPTHTLLQDGGVLDLGPKRMRQYIQEGVEAGEPLQFGLTFTPDREALNQAPADVAVPVSATSAPPGLLNRSFHGGAANMMLWQRVTGSPGHGGFAGMVAGLMALALLATAVVLAWRQTRRRNLPESSVGDEPEPDVMATPSAPRPELLRRRAELLRLAEELDRQRLAGEVDEEHHRTRREEIKNELVRVLVGLKQSEG